jgi:hypothetical protein
MMYVKFLTIAAQNGEARRYAAARRRNKYRYLSASLVTPGSAWWEIGLLCRKIFLLYVCLI